MFQSYSFTQPYYLYVEMLKYNVIPSNITLNFDSLPSTNPSDYQAIITNGIIMFEEAIGFSTIDNTLQFSGNSVIITLPINIDTNAYIKFYYQTSLLPFTIRAAQDPTYQTPAIFLGLPL